MTCQTNADGTATITIPELPPSNTRPEGMKLDEIMSKIRNNPLLIALLLPASTDSMDPLTQRMLEQKLRSKTEETSHAEAKRAIA